MRNSRRAVPCSRASRWRRRTAPQSRNRWRRDCRHCTRRSPAAPAAPTAGTSWAPRRVSTLQPQPCRPGAAAAASSRSESCIASPCGCRRTEYKCRTAGRSRCRGGRQRPAIGSKGFQHCDAAIAASGAFQLHSSCKQLSHYALPLCLQEWPAMPARGVGCILTWTRKQSMEDAQTGCHPIGRTSSCPA